MSGDQESSPQHLALAGSGHREGIRHTMMTYLGHTSPPASKGESPVKRPCSDHDVTTTARLRETYIHNRHRLNSTSPPFSKVALLLAALTFKFVHNTQCLTNLLQGWPGTDCTSKTDLCTTPMSDHPSPRLAWHWLHYLKTCARHTMSVHPSPRLNWH